MAAAAALSELSLADQQQEQQQQQQISSAREDALHNPAILGATFSWMYDDLDLARCSTVCRTWQSVLQADDIWRNVYLQHLPPPAQFERVSSFRQQFGRLRGLMALQDPGPTALKGSALCFNAASGNLVSFNARQRMLSIQLPDGLIRSEVLDAEGAGSASKPLLASSGSTLVVLAAFDGVLQLWDAGCCQQAGLLGRHPSFILSLAASGNLAASTCSSELRLWKLSSRQCLFTVPIGFPMAVSPARHEPLPHVAVCEEQQLLALANATTPAPCSVIKVYSTLPAANPSSGAGTGGFTGAGSSSGTAAAAAGVTVGSSAAPGAAGAVLLRELPANAADSMLLQQGLLLVASCFHATSWSHNTPYKAERPYTVTVQIWDTQHWQLTRLVSPRLWTDYPVTAMQGMPIIALTQGLLLCATLKSSCADPPGRPQSCSIQAWQLTRQLLLRPHAVAATGSLQLLGVNGGRRQPEPFGEGATALGRAALATIGGAGSAGVSASNTVMLAVTDNERNHWSQLLLDTGGRLTQLVITPTQLVLATEGGNVLSSPLLLETEGSAGAVPDQAAAGGEGGGGSAAGAGQQQEGVVTRFVHVGL